MALTKVTYVDGETVIGAANINAIQDEIINNADDISDLNTNKVDKVEGKGLSTNDYTDAEKTKVEELPTVAGLTESFNGKVDKVPGKGLSTNDYDDEAKSKLDNLGNLSELDFVVVTS